MCRGPVVRAAGVFALIHYAGDAIAREPQYQVEYGLVDGMGGYRTLVRDFVPGGCAALDQHGPWMSDVAEFERTRRRRDAR